ncbi:MAG: SufE family protein [Pseudomonadota bacterium]
MSIQDRADDIAAEFEFLDDWEDRYAHIIDLGKQNPPLSAEERNEVTRVRGCASQVWMIAREDQSHTLELRAESDALIVSGLIALLIRLFHGAATSDVAAFDAKAFLDQIGITDALSAQRSNGLSSMLVRIKQTVSPDPVA